MRRVLFLIVFLPTILFGVFASGGPVLADQAYRHAETIAEIVRPLVESGVLQAASIGVIDNSQRWSGHFGHLEKGRPDIPKDDTIYEVGSISKVITGILLAQAVVSGELTLETTLGDVFPEVSRTNPEVATSIRLRHLATHTSGLPRMPSNIRPADPLDPYADYDRELMTEFIGSIKPKAKPGAPSGYSNFGFGLLGELLAIKSERSYAALLSSNLTGPLAMTDTAITTSDAALGRLAPPHLANGGPVRPWNFSAMAGAGAIRSTIDDMLRFISAQLDPPAGRLGEAIDLAWQKHSDASDDSPAMALGWHIARDGSTRWHNGQTGGYHSMMLVSRKRDAGVVVLSNSATDKVDEIGEAILRMIAGNGD